jgi:hypothetical protein
MWSITPKLALLTRDSMFRSTISEIGTDLPPTALIFPLDLHLH